MTTGTECPELYGSGAPPQIRQLLDSVRDASPDEIGAALRTAISPAPRSLAAYYHLLYTLYAGSGACPRAREVATGGLAVAAGEAGPSLDRATVGVEDADFATPGPARFWLFTLKALAFINVKLGEPDEAPARLDKLRVLDPTDGVGFSVIAALLAKFECG